MHLRFVEVFCDVAQRRSFSKGAAAHNLSQSSASQAVSFLEKRLGTKLIDRSKRPLELTPAGRVYFDGCRELLERFRAIEDQVQQFHDRVTGTVRVAAIYSVGLMQMEQSVQTFAERYPEARLRVEYLHPDQVCEQVQNDEADLGLVSFPRPSGEIVSLDWQRQPMVLVAPPAHRLASQPSIGLSELDGEDYIGFTRDLTIRREVDRWLKRARVAVNVVHEFDNIETIKRAIEIGSGVALLPSPTVWQEISSRTLVAVPIADSEFFRPLGIIHKRHKQLTAAVQKFIELLQHEAPEPVPGATQAGQADAVGQAPDDRVAGRARGRSRSKRAPV
ncbi:MAG: LysR family transcriptional regulator [Planctomycetaceae bacterium]|nr:LysR family transcriptional regulator [Planctomycetaceae bacterium]